MKSIIHPGAALVTPYRQGRFDALCGLYAIINAIRVVHAVAEPLSGQSCRALFKAGVQALTADKRTRTAVWEGMTVGSQGRLLRTLALHPILQRRRPLGLVGVREKLKRADSINMFVKAAVKHGSVLLVSLEGRMSHHTVITGVSDQRIILCDSVGMQFVFTNSMLQSVDQPGSLRIRNIYQLGV